MKFLPRKLYSLLHETPGSRIASCPPQTGRLLSLVFANGYKSVVQDLAKAQLGFVVNERSVVLPISTIRLFSTESEHSFVVSYLTNSCGLSPQSAKSVSNKVNFRSADRPDSVLIILRNHGFTNTHIAKLIKIRPKLLIADPERTVLPKLKFFKSIGVTDPDLASVCSANPVILAVSLDNVLIPKYYFLKSLLLSDENVVEVFRRKSWIFQLNLLKLPQKFDILRELGVPESFFPLSLTCYIHVILQSNERFDENVKKVIGFDPRKFGFIHVMHIFTSFCQSNLECKFDVLRRWGWSDDDILLAFKRCPSCMNTSENKLTDGMDFLVNKMGWQSKAIVFYPPIFLLNLEKQVIPRCSVIKVLQSKGLVKTTMSLGAFLQPSEKQFLDKFVTTYTHRSSIVEYLSEEGRSRGSKYE